MEIVSKFLILYKKTLLMLALPIHLMDLLLSLNDLERKTPNQRNLVRTEVLLD